MARVDVDSPAHTPSAATPLPEGISGREALFLLRALARVKKQRFGRVTVTVSDGLVVDIELTEKMDRGLLQNF